MTEQLGLRLIYCNAAGETGEHELIRWAEAGHYVKGFSTLRDRVLTFRKDRIHRYLDGCEKLVRDPVGLPPPRLSRDRPKDTRPQILFTGFPKLQRAVLERRAEEGGLRVVQSVTDHLVFLCCGPNAGPAKVEKARERKVYIVKEPEFFVLLETGELPDAAMELLL